MTQNESWQIFRRHAPGVFRMESDIWGLRRRALDLIYWFERNQRSREADEMRYTVKTLDQIHAAWKPHAEQIEKEKPALIAALQSVPMLDNQLGYLWVIGTVVGAVGSAYIWVRGDVEKEKAKIESAEKLAREGVPPPDKPKEKGFFDQFSEWIKESPSTVLLVTGFGMMMITMMMARR